MSEPASWSPSQLAEQRIARRRSTYYATLNLWPFVSVMLALLIPYITITPHRSLFGKPVDLARTQHATPQPDALREDAVIVSLTRDGSIFLRHIQLQLVDVRPQVEAALRTTDMKKVFVRADARAKYGDVKAVAELLRQAGVTRLCFLVEKDEMVRNY